MIYIQFMDRVPTAQGKLIEIFPCKEFKNLENYRENTGNCYAFVPNL